MGYSTLNLAFWLLLPISAVQGLLLRRKALRLPPPEGNTQGVFQSGLDDDRPGLTVLAAGDSIIAGVGAKHQSSALPAQFAMALAEARTLPVCWRATGTNGARLSDLLIQLESMPSQQEATVLLLSIGVNDVTGLTSTRAWREQISRLIIAIRARWPDALVVFAGLPPMDEFPLPPQPLRFTLGMRARALDRIAATALAAQHGMVHIPTIITAPDQGFCADGFHPGSEAYAVWAKELVKQLAGYALPLR